jgi:quercetin dioxygenase-like cupin family protein
MYKDVVVSKPWGHEYLAYENEEVGLWFLNIKKNQRTSMHSHPQKTTGLILLDGEAELSFLADSRKLVAPSKVMIRRGLFHSTKALSENALIFEIETPKDKHDLVRLNDTYGRSKLTYEGEKFESSKSSKELWIEEPDLGKSIEYNFANCKLKVETIDDIEVINNKKNSDIIVFLKGGMVRSFKNTTHRVTMPGDVGHGSIIKEVSSQLDGVVKNTIILTIKKDEQ